MTRRCGDCQWWRVFSPASDDGACEHGPPACAPDGTARFPIIWRESYCGQFRLRETGTDMRTKA